MPVKVWELDPKGRLVSEIKTDWDVDVLLDERRREAEELDRQLDGVLDNAATQVEEVERKVPGMPPEFLRAWAIGKALRTSAVAEHPAVKGERRELLWRALARKCRLGARADASTDDRWIDLRPKGAGEPRREGGKLDYFEMCLWLSEQDFAHARSTFGGHIRNVWQMLERPTLRVLKVRSALQVLLVASGNEDLTRPSTFAEMMKTLRARWPDRGPGSAKRPVHYSFDELKAEMESVLHSFLVGTPATSA